MKEALVLMARAPVEGAVKTRLVGELTSAEVLDLYLCLLRDTFAVMEDVREDREEREDFALILCHTPDDAEEPFEQVDHDGCLMLPQGEGDLGDRLAACFTSLFANGCQRVVVIGADTPHLPADFILEAFEALETGAEAVIGPSADQGYYLLGLARLPEHFFTGIEWGTDRVLAATERRLEEFGLPTHRLSPLTDIDTARDLEMLRADLDEGRFEAPATHRYLRRLGTSLHDRQLHH